jgi:hypothetical protein
MAGCPGVGNVAFGVVVLVTSYLLQQASPPAFSQRVSAEADGETMGSGTENGNGADLVS